MSHSTAVTEADLDATRGLIGEAADLRHRPGVAARHVLRGLQNMLQAAAPASLLYTGCMAARNGARFEYLGRDHQGDLPEEWVATFDRRLARGYSPVLDGIRAEVPTANVVGSRHVHTRRQLVRESVWRRSPIYAGDILPLKISDQIFAWYQTPRYAAMFILRGTDGRVFEEREIRLVDAALGLLHEDARLVPCLRPATCQPRLSSVERAVRDLLICGLRPEAIRQRLSTAARPVTYNTVAKYINTVLRKYRVPGERNHLVLAFFRRGGDVNQVLAMHELAEVPPPEELRYPG